ncbi:MAG: HAD family phosphatase, partial [Candidatus Cloacimonetes bacterium]|nr:HAD family phosphatase [Candidatus Cloacimonadota bacterium]
MKIKAIIFDLDGTLIDSMGLWREVDEEFLTSRGIVVPEDLFDNLPSGNSFIQTAEYFRTRFGLTETNAQIMKI